MGIGKVLAATAIGIGVLGGIGFVVYKSPVGQQFVNRANQEELGMPVIMETVTFGDLERTVSAPGSRLQRFAQGSVSEEVLRCSQLPVLSLHRG